MSRRELEALTRRYVAEIIDAIGPDKDVPAPDVNTNEQMMAWIMDTYSMHVGRTETAIVTGKPVVLGGSLGRREATGRGVMICTREAAKHLGSTSRTRRSPCRASATWLGLGGPAARSGAKLVAVTDWQGGVYNDGRPRRPGADRRGSREHKTVDGFPGADPITNERLFELDVDVLIPAALENQITPDNAADIKAKVIVEGANGPTTPDAHKILHERGVFVVPDILANAGGVTGSYFEWVQNRHGYYWTEAEVNRRSKQKMVEAFDAVLRTSLKYKVDMRTAAYIVAIDRVATVTRLRGMYA